VGANWPEKLHVPAFSPCRLWKTDKEIAEGSKSARSQCNVRKRFSLKIYNQLEETMVGKPPKLDGLTAAHITARLEAA
jgi:hypothetical protein